MGVFKNGHKSQRHHQNSDHVFFRKGNFFVYQYCSFPFSPDRQVARLLATLKEECRKGNVISSLTAMDALIPGFSKNIEFYRSLNVLNTTRRQFGENGMEHVSISPFLGSLSLEAIHWIILSIAKDHMTPSDRLIQSRVKEYFGVRVGFDDWQAFLVHLIQNYEKQAERFPILRNWSIQIASLKDSDGQDTSRYEIYLKEMSWPLEDKPSAVLLPDQEPLYKDFLDFLEKFFESSEAEKSMTSWLSTVENASRRPERNNINQLQRGMALRDIKKGIPGGKYGCCQFIKHCGPKKLQSLPIGTLTKFTQLALTQEKVAYFKTILVPNTPKTSQVSNDETLKEIEIHTQKTKELLLKMLRLPPFDQAGIKMSLIPQQVKELFDYKIETINLGVSKLKSFLKTLPEVQLTKHNSNIIIATLKEQPIPKAIDMSPIKRVPLSQREEASGIRPRSISVLLGSEKHPNEPEKPCSFLRNEFFKESPSKPKTMESFLQEITRALIMESLEVGYSCKISAQKMFDKAARVLGLSGLRRALKNEGHLCTAEELAKFIKTHFDNQLETSSSFDSFKARFFHSDSVFFAWMTNSEEEELEGQSEESFETDDESRSHMTVSGKSRDQQQENFLSLCYEVVDAAIGL